MSDTANWSYANTATVWPVLAEDDAWGGSSPSYGAPYFIACTWVGGGDETSTAPDGREFVPKYKFYHEDKRVKYGDLIAKGEQTDQLVADPIQNHVEYDMSFFDEEPDFLSVV